MDIWLDGRIVAAAQARVSPMDGGFRLGDGVFSTLLALDGHPQHLEAHVDRIVHDAAALGITDVDGGRLRAAALEVADRNRAAGALALRLVVTRGTDPRQPTVAVLATVAPATAPTCTVTLVEGGRRPAAVKSTSWAWSAQAIATARSRSADTAVLVEGRDVLEGAAANVLVRLGDRWHTPPADGRILPGTTRAVLLAGLDDLREARVDVAELREADEVVLTSALRGAVAVTAVDDRDVGDGTPGPLTAAARELLRDAGIGPIGR